MSSTSNSKLNKKTSSNKKNNDKQIFKRTVDAFFANDLDRKSAEKYIFKLFDDMIDWAIKKQFIVSIFIIEAKLFSMLHADKKLIWWIHFFQKLKFDSNQKIMIYNDNLQTIRLLISKIFKIETKLRHVDIAQCWLRQSVQSDYLSINYLSIAKMIANELTKILSSQKHREFINQLRLVDAEFLIKEVECDKQDSFTLMTKEVWLSSCESINDSNAIKQDSSHISDEQSLINSKRIFSTRTKDLASIETF
jgi:hypothetical protein